MGLVFYRNCLLCKELQYTTRFPSPLEVSSQRKAILEERLRQTEYV